MNNRTEKLVELVNVIKLHNKKHAQAEKARLRTHQTHQTVEVQAASQEEERAAQEVEAYRAVYANTQNTVTQELVQFEKQKARDMRIALRDYVRVQLRYERQKLETAEKAISKIRTGDYDVRSGISKQSSTSIGVMREPVPQMGERGEDNNVEGFVDTWVAERTESLDQSDIFTGVSGGTDVWQKESERIGEESGERGYAGDFFVDSRDALRGNDPLSVGGGF